MSLRNKVFGATLIFHQGLARLFGKRLHFYTTGIFDKPIYGKLDSNDPRLATLELSSREIYSRNIPGATAELGVYQGGFAERINHFFTDRKLYLFDTFEGFDSRDAEIDRSKNYSTGDQDWTKTSVELVLSKMEHRENCIVKKGWFPETAKDVDEKFCFVSIDTDLYKPILEGLKFFYPRLNHGGVIMVHDFNNCEYTGVRDAVKEFCDENNTGYVCLSDGCGSAVITR